MTILQLLTYFMRGFSKKNKKTFNVIFKEANYKLMPIKL